MVRDMAREFAKNALKSISDRPLFEQTLWPETRATLGETGVVVGVFAPAEHGNGEIEHVSCALVPLFRNSVPYRASSSPANRPRVAGHPRPYRHPGDSRVPEILSTSGESVGRHALTQANAGSDPASLRKAARGDEDSRVINGEKRFTTTNGIAHSIIRRMGKGADIESGPTTP